MTITGSLLDDATTATFGDSKPVPTTDRTANSVNCTTPEQNCGNVEVFVTTSDGKKSNTVPYRYE